MEAEWTEALVLAVNENQPALNVMQGHISGLRQAIQALRDLRARYEEGDDGDDGESVG